MAEGRRRARRSQHLLLNRPIAKREIGERRSSTLVVRFRPADGKSLPEGIGSSTSDSDSGITPSVVAPVDAKCLIDKRSGF